MSAFFPINLGKVLHLPAKMRDVSAGHTPKIYLQLFQKFRSFSTVIVNGKRGRF